jgi:hypothetical protein
MNRATLPKFRIAALLALVSILPVLLGACTNTLFKVKPPSELGPMPASAPTFNAGTVTFRAAPLLSDEETQELFDSNLQLAGLLPVRVEMTHNSGEPLEFKKVRLRLQDANGTQWKMISSKQAISRILKANGITLYNPNARKNFENDFRAYELDLKTPFAHSEGKRQGLVVFQSPEKLPVASPQGMVLSIEGLAQPISLKLN